MISVGDAVEVKIEKMVYEGYGLGFVDNTACFIENACDGDIVEARITKTKKNCAFGVVDKIITPSEYRVEPFCPLHNVCGGCQWQFIDYQHQLEVKKSIVKDILSKTLHRDIEVNETLPSPQTREYRHKIQMPVSQTKNSKRFLIGYYKKQSHDIVNIKYCPIQPQIINEIIEKIRVYATDYDVESYNEQKHNGELRHIIFRISAETNDIILALVVNNNKISKPVRDFGLAIFNEFKEIKGVSVNFNENKNNVILGRTTQNLAGDETYNEKLGEISYIVSPESFFQINPKSFKNILDKVKEQIKNRSTNPRILDTYSGVGSFGLYLSDIAKEVTCVEEVEQACKNAKKACEINKISNINIINGDAQVIFEDLINKKELFNVTILDPPRKGCTLESLKYCTDLTKDYIVYISCNPISLARDVKYLEDLGFELVFVQTADMFCHSYHVETIAIIEKKDNLR